MIKVNRISHTKCDTYTPMELIKPRLVTTITYNDLLIAEVSSLLCVWNNDISDTADETLILHAGLDDERFGDYDSHDEAVEYILSRLNHDDGDGDSGDDDDDSFWGVPWSQIDSPQC